MYPFDVILRGSGIDALENQRLAYAGFNQRTDEGNRSAIAQAQAVQNNWLAQVAAQRDAAHTQDLSMQQNADTAARQSVLQSHADALAAKNRAEDIALNRESDASKMAFNREQLAQQQKIADDKIEAATKNKEMIVDSAGQHLAANYQAVKNNLDAAEAAHESVQANIDDLKLKQEEESAKGKNADPLKQLQISASLKTYNADVRQREAAKQRAQNEFNRLQNKAENQGFDINDDGTIVHRETGKKWSWKTAVKEAAKTASAPAPAPAASAPELSFWERAKNAASAALPALGGAVGVADAYRFGQTAPTNAQPATASSLPTAAELPGMAGRKQLTPEIARSLLTQAGGDKDAARKLAREQGYVW